MNPFNPLPAPLTIQEFYVLLALVSDNSHAYNLISRVMNASLGSVRLASGTLYPLLQRLHDEGLVDMLEAQASGVSGKKRRQYGISEHGKLRLTEELQRIRHAAQIGEEAGLLDDPTPVDIRRLLLEVQ